MELADVSAMVEKIRNHRFDGYTDTGVATEIEKFRSGDGIGSIGAAVDALKNVAVALADTDDTLRRELGKLGVEWQSQAGGQAAQVFTDQAGFSQDAMAKVDHSAEMIFAQGEAFNRTLYKLPDAATVRKGAGGFTVGDAALSLIGFETDHARDVVAAQNARAQAVEALNAYATASGDNLSSIESMAQPQNLLLNESAQDPSAIDLAGSAVDVGPGPDKGETGGDTRAAKSDSVVKDAGPVSNPTPKPHVSTPHHTAAPVVNVQAPRPSAPPPAAPEPGTTAPSGSTPPSAPPRPPSSGGGSPVIPPSHGPGQQPTPGGRPGEPLPPGVPCPPERSVNNVLGGPSSGSGPSGAEGGKGSGGGKPGGFGGPGGSAAEGGSGRSGGFAGGSAGGSAGGGGSEQSLAKGKLMGSGPQAPTVPGEVGRPFPAIPKSAGLGAGELGAGAVAAGAGGVGGATSGETERQGRGFGRGMVANSGKPVRQLPMGELPEEEAAALRNSEKLSPRKETGKPSMLETAAPQGTRGDEDAEHVRRFGIDDKDLFADQRMVSPDLIGDNGAEETR
jgi:hypothetical protein